MQEQLDKVIKILDNLTTAQEKTSNKIVQLNERVKALECDLKDANVKTDMLERFVVQLEDALKRKV